MDLSILGFVYAAQWVRKKKKKNQISGAYEHDK